MNVQGINLRHFQFHEPKTTTTIVKSELTGEGKTHVHSEPLSADLSLEAADESALTFQHLPGLKPDCSIGSKVDFKITIENNNIKLNSTYHTSGEYESYEVVNHKYVEAGRGITDAWEEAHYEDEMGYVTRTRWYKHDEELKIKNSEEFSELLELLGSFVDRDKEVSILIGSLEQVGKHFIPDRLKALDEKIKLEQSRADESIKKLNERKEQLLQQSNK